MLTQKYIMLKLFFTTDEMTFVVSLSLIKLKADVSYIDTVIGFPSHFFPTSATKLS